MFCPMLGTWATTRDRCVCSLVSPTRQSQDLAKRTMIEGGATLILIMWRSKVRRDAGVSLGLGKLPMLQGPHKLNLQWRHEVWARGFQEEGPFGGVVTPLWDQHRGLVSKKQGAAGRWVSLAQGSWGAYFKLNICQSPSLCTLINVCWTLFYLLLRSVSTVNISGKLPKWWQADFWQK